MSLTPAPKPWWESKTIWFNLVLTVVEIASMLEQAPAVPHEALPWIALVHGVGNVIIRVLFTDKPVTLN